MWDYVFKQETIVGGDIILLIFCNALSLSLDSCQYILLSAPVSVLLYPLCVLWDGRCWSIRLFCVSKLYTAVHYVFVHKELVSPPFTIYTESKQIVSIH